MIVSKLNNFLNNKRNLYAIAFIAVVLESLSTTCLKIGGQYPFLSPMYLFFFGLTLLIMGIYAVTWQLVLERLPLTTAYLRKGITYILVFLWAYLFFGEEITIQQIIGIVVIFIGMVVSMRDEQ